MGPRLGLAKPQNEKNEECKTGIKMGSGDEDRFIKTPTHTHTPHHARPDQTISDHICINIAGKLT